MGSNLVNSRSPATQTPGCIVLCPPVRAPLGIAGSPSEQEASSWLRYTKLENGNKGRTPKDAESGRRILAYPGRGIPPWSLPSQTLGLRVLIPLAHREGNHHHYDDDDRFPTIASQADIEVEIKVATDVKLWHNRLARGKYVG